MQGESSLFEAMGGTVGCRRLSEAFYGRVDGDPLLRPFFPGKTHTCAIEEFTAFLVQFLEGPEEDSQRRWWLSLRESHLRFRIGAKVRDAWVRNMVAAFEEAQIAEPARAALLNFFQDSSAYVVNTGTAPPVAPHALHPEIDQRWNAQRRLDETVAAIRAGDVERAVSVAESRVGTVAAGLLAAMLESGHPALLHYIHERLSRDPSLVAARFNGRTLLHVAAARGRRATVEFLLRAGADARVRDGGSHTPLYALANQCGDPRAAGIVRVLVDAGADVNAADGVKRATPLHMAARRDHVAMAAALLDCGADIEAQDSLRETPLRRAVNCGKVEVAALLVARGANRNSKGSKGLTPLQAARTVAMKRALDDR